MFMPYRDRLYKATFIERPNRFIIRARKEDGETVTAHLPDPGRLIELLIPGREIWLRYVDNPKRKTQWSAVLCESEDARVYVSLDTMFPNRLITQALKEKRIESLKKYNYIRAEYPFAGARWDFLLENKGRSLLLEVKSVTLAENGIAYFPDAVTARGRKHVEALTTIQNEGNCDTAVLFVVQRGDVTSVRPATHIDPAFASALQKAADAGVAMLAVTTDVRLEGVELGQELPVQLNIQKGPIK
ncbi:DNA/RNA nuclease SfsA [Salicibibacter cibarius]|uniref:Sugar fermentation stimulation protein homolog n=1 Tax=Salicibibacter cibarius TaxID=2743000 RepID=A0A7T7CDP8_9BACI|nr:DNA/RNA nuclease SfsA [Salicibibacter cibarius]QQK78228.1 DNA/RNA nuclease SfsA [Salicibibacter cibarius]